MVKVVFMGTPDFAVPTLRALHQQQTVVGVVTQPDRPAGRGKQLVASPVKEYTLHAGLPLLQPERLREPDALAQLEAWQPEVIVVAAFGQILRPRVLNLPPRGCLNVHASLLPRHRGAAPIAAAILAGDAETGVTIMQMDVGLDTGPMLSERREPIRAEDTTQTLAARLAQVGAELLNATLPAYLAGTLTPRAQDEAQATYAPQLKKEDGHLDFTRSAVELERRVRAFSPWPGAYALWQGQPFKLLRVAVSPEHSGEPGRVWLTATGPAVSCGEGSLVLSEVQPAGKKPMRATDFARGAKGFVGANLI